MFLCHCQTDALDSDSTGDSNDSAATEVGLLLYCIRMIVVLYLECDADLFSANQRYNKSRCWVAVKVQNKQWMILAIIANKQWMILAIIAKKRYKQWMILAIIAKKMYLSDCSVVFRM